MATLIQYWNDEITRINAARATLDIAALRLALQQAETTQRNTAQAIRTQQAAVDNARRALANIAMPADSDPLLTNMRNAQAALSQLQAELAAQELEIQQQRKTLSWQEQRLQNLDNALKQAQTSLDDATRAAALRQQLTDALQAGGQFETIASDAASILTNLESTARSRVEGEFPVGSSADKDLLKRIRHRRTLVADSLSASQATAISTLTSEVDKAQQTMDSAHAAIAQQIDYAKLINSDSHTLQQLANLPAVNPILSTWQRNALHANLSNRETALAKLTAVDNAQQALISAREAYAQAYHTAFKNQPDKTSAQLDALAAVASKKTLYSNAQTDLQTARSALSADDITLLQHWFASVPETLWHALESLDLACSRLNTLKNATVATLISNLNSAESDYVSALSAARLAERKQYAASLAQQRATHTATGEQQTTTQRSRAFSRSAMLY